MTSIVFCYAPRMRNKSGAELPSHYANDMAIDHTRDREPVDRVVALRHAFLDRLWSGMFVIALFGAPASVSRTVVTGWQPVYALHLAVGALVALLYFARRRISYPAKLRILLALFAVIGASGIFTMGLLGSGVWYLIICSLLTSTFFPVRTGVLVVILSGAGMVIAALLFTQGILTIPFDSNVYVSSLSGWASMLISASIMPFVVFTAFGVYQKTIFDLVRETEQQRDKIAELAGKDQLTGLPMAKLANDRFQMKVHSAQRSHARVAVMFVDLNGFKQVNDTWGHEAGDHLLITIAKRLQASVRNEDTVGRIGGDEFVVIVGKLGSRDEAVPVAEKLIANVCLPVDYAGQSIPCGASIGIAIFPEDASDLATLRRLADRAMYQVKRSGRSGFAFADNAPLSDFGERD